MAAAWLLFLAVLAPALAQNNCKSEHLVQMSDGVILTTFLTIPEPCDQKRSAVMDATPYGPTVDLFADTYVPEGFVSVMQNQRGCFTSGGTYNFWKQDGQDHYDTMVWLKNQTWFNGETYIVGISADSISAYADGMILNPMVYAGYMMWGSAYGHETSYWNGAYRGGLISHWLLTLNTCPNAVNIETQVRQNEAYTNWWAPIEAMGPYGNNYPNTMQPTIHQAGWWDIFSQPQIATYNGLRLYAGSQTARDNAWLWIIPLGHCTLNGFDYPGWEIADPQAQSVGLFRQNYSAPLWNYIDKLNIYVFGPVPAVVGLNASWVGNYYTSLPNWPVYTSTNYYLSANGQIAMQPPNTTGVRVYKYDPTNPAPQLGGNNLYGPCGPNDERSNEARPDYLVWNLPGTFTSPYALCGEFNATITVSSDAVDTDFIVYVNDVYPTGQSIPVRYGPVRMRWRNGPMTPVMMTPGQLYTVTLSLWSSCYIFNVGHGLRVSITSSKNPEISVNPNNGLPLSQGLVPGTPVVATNSVYWGPNQQTYVTLPMVPLSALPPNPQIH